jgi:Ca2+-binding RTX toxin-like protein
MTENIVIGEDYVVTTKQHLEFTDGGYAFYFDQSGASAPSLTNKGHVLIASDVAEGIGADKHSDLVIFNNASSGVFTVSGMASAVGFDISISAVLHNDGNIVVSSSDGDARGVVARAAENFGDLSIVNSSMFVVEGATKALGAYYQESGTVDNSGLFQVVGGKSAEGVVFDNFGGFHNTGQFLISGPHAVGVEFHQAQFLFTNDGQIAVGAGKDVSYGVLIAPPEPNDGLDDSPSLTNSGVIRADYAIFDDRQDVRGFTGDVIANSGAIYGDILLGSYDDRLTNSGFIKGDVELGGGDDVYGVEGKGIIHGTLFGGSGADALWDGPGADVTHGDGPEPSAADGADTISGARGDDQLFGEGGDDRLLGGRGADLLSGGAGADTFLYIREKESTAGHADLIADLSPNDVIDLSMIDADRSTKQTNDAFTLVASFDGHAGELVVSYDAGTDTTSIEGDVNGDGVGDMVITAAGDHTAVTCFAL